MEVINLPGYLEHDKIEIATGFIIPKLLKQHGLKSNYLSFQKAAILQIIREYTREAGVRNLERELSAICRKVTKELVQNGKAKSVTITKAKIEKYLGVPKFPEHQREAGNMIGAAWGLAWTGYGGDILQIEVNVMKGKGNLSLTGKLGDVMQESAKAAFSYARTNAKDLGITDEFWKAKDIHIHIPEGATPKDGPSAGITIATALISALTNKKIRDGMAMTGEITLKGNVLGIGGLNEKLLAAKRFNIKTVMIPSENERELSEIKDEVKKGIKIIFVKKMDEVLKVAFV